MSYRHVELTMLRTIKPSRVLVAPHRFTASRIEWQYTLTDDRVDIVVKLIGQGVQMVVANVDNWSDVPSMWMPPEGFMAACDEASQ